MAPRHLVLVSFLLSLRLGGALAASPTTCAVKDNACDQPPSISTAGVGSASACALFCRAPYTYYAYQVSETNCFCYQVCPLAPFAGITAGLTAANCPGGYGDPHFLDAHGVRFDFNEAAKKSYCLVADKDLQVNAHLQGQLQAGTSKPLSWMNWPLLHVPIPTPECRGLGFSYVDQQGATHELEMRTREGKDSKRGDTGFLSHLSFDGAPLVVPKEAGDEVAPGGGLSLKMVDNAGVIKEGLERDTLLLSIENTLTMQIKLNAETEAMQTPDDANVHFNFEIIFIKTSGSVHGLLGQSFRTGPSRKLRASQYMVLSKLLNAPVIADGETGAGYLDGKPEDYETSTLTARDCKFSP